jgi:hypothetical protein
MRTAGILDVLATKRSAVKLAADAAITILRVDTVRQPLSSAYTTTHMFTDARKHLCLQIIMAKPAGGPKK